MTRISGDIYSFRGVTITRFLGGWWTDCDLTIYKTLKDAENGVKKHLDGSNTEEPRTIGTAQYKNAEWFLSPS